MNSELRSFQSCKVKTILDQPSKLPSFPFNKMGVDSVSSSSTCVSKNSFTSSFKPSQNLRVYIILVSLKSPLSVLFLPVATWLLECGTVLGTTLAARKVVFQPRHDGDADAIDGDQRLHVLLGWGHATRWGSHTVIFRVFKPAWFFKI